MRTIAQAALFMGLVLTLQVSGFAAEGEARIKFAGCSISAGAYMKDMGKSFEERKL